MNSIKEVRYFVLFPTRAFPLGILLWQKIFCQSFYLILQGKGVILQNPDIKPKH